MNINELVQSAKQGSEDLASVPDAKARTLIRNAFQEIRREIERAGAEPVRIGGLGMFRTKEVKKPGETEGTKRIVFRPAAPKE